MRRWSAATSRRSVTSPSGQVTRTRSACDRCPTHLGAAVPRLRTHVALAHALLAQGRAEEAAAPAETVAGLLEHVRDPEVDK